MNTKKGSGTLVACGRYDGRIHEHGGAMRTFLWTLPKASWSTCDRIAWKLVGLLALTMSLDGATGAWAAQVSPSALVFSVTQGGVNPGPQTVNYSNAG